MNIKVGDTIEFLPSVRTADSFFGVQLKATKRLGDVYDGPQFEFTMTRLGPAGAVTDALYIGRTLWLAPANYAGRWKIVARNGFGDWFKTHGVKND